MRYIKLPVHFFEDDKLRAIRSQKDGDSVILLYTMLITVAVKIQRRRSADALRGDSIR
jgi:cytochrome c oxidase assembly protein Cox11